MKIIMSSVTTCAFLVRSCDLNFNITDCFMYITVATPTKTMQSTATPASNTAAMPTATAQPKESKEYTLYYIVGGAGFGVVVIVTLIIVLIIVACYRKKSKVDFRPLLQFGEDDSDEEEEEEEYTNINNSGSEL